MIKIRHGVFETNSSSTHSICISRKPVDVCNGHIDFRFCDAGWNDDAVEPENYLYTAIMCLGYDKHKERLLKLTDILDSHSVTYTLEKPKWVTYDYVSGKYLDYDCGSIDHVDELEEWVDMILDNEDMLMRFLFGKGSIVYTGNDNMPSDKGYACDEYIDDGWYDWETKTYHEKLRKNPYHDSDKYEYYFKGN